MRVGNAKTEKILDNNNNNNNNNFKNVFNHVKIVLVFNQLSIMSRRRIVEWGYSSTILDLGTRLM
jgi:hypothetical protein